MDRPVPAGNGERKGAGESGVVVEPLQIGDDPLRYLLLQAGPELTQAQPQSNVRDGTARVGKDEADVGAAFHGAGEEQVGNGHGGLEDELHQGAGQDGPWPGGLPRDVGVHEDHRGAPVELVYQFVEIRVAKVTIAAAGGQG